MRSSSLILVGLFSFYSCVMQGSVGNLILFCWIPLVVVGVTVFSPSELVDGVTFLAPLELVPVLFGAPSELVPFLSWMMRRNRWMASMCSGGAMVGS